ARARAPTTAVKALSRGSRLPISASAASITAAALISPPLTACAISAADAETGSRVAASGMEHRRRLGVVSQREFRDQRPEAQCYLQVRLDRRPPFRLRGQTKRARGSIDEIIQRLARRSGGSFCRDGPLAARACRPCRSRSVRGLAFDA